MTRWSWCEGRRQNEHRRNVGQELIRRSHRELVASLLRTEHPVALRGVRNDSYHDLLERSGGALDDTQMPQVYGIERPGVEGHSHARKFVTIAMQYPRTPAP